MKAPKALLTRACSFETRAKDDDDGLTLEGYAAVFDDPTRIDSWEGTFDEVIAAGAFAKTIRDRKPVMQFDHGHDIATGSVPIGSIEDIREDRQGLFVRARLHDNARVEPIRQAIASGAIDGMSFRFRVIREEWDESGDTPVRTIREVELFELGPVVFPAYASTTVGVRSLLADLDDTDRGRLIAELAREVSTISDAAPQGTSDEPPDAGQEATSGSTHGEREFFLRSLTLKESAA
jgi:HK97 family phage prohead protease